MRGFKQLGWVAVAALTVATLPQGTLAADASLEERVRALEKKVAREQKEEAAGQKTVIQRIEVIEKEVKDTEKSIGDKLGVEFHGFVAANYNYNLNSPDSHNNRIHVFDETANSIELDQANINVQRNKPEGLGFNLDLDFGKTAEVVGRTTQWRSNSNSDKFGLAGANSSVELRQAYLKYAFADSGFSLMAGKFVTFHGAEVIKAYNNFNYNISNSILFGFAIPFTHTGVIGTYAFGDLGSIAAGVVNGWDNVSDNNDGKSLTSMLTLTPSPMFTFNLATTYGPEENNNGRSKRLLITPLITVKPTDQLTLILDYNYGNESNTAPGLPTVMWQGMAGYVIVAVTDAVQLSLRGEVFDDPDGFRTGFTEPGRGPGATFWEVTPTVAYKITDGLTWRAECRHDESDKRFFDKDNRDVSHGGRGQRGQDLVATELIYAF